MQQAPGQSEGSKPMSKSNIERSVDFPAPQPLVFPPLKWPPSAFHHGAATGRVNPVVRSFHTDHNVAIVDGVLSNEECRYIIHAAEAVGLQPVTANFPAHFRNNSLVDLWAPEFTVALWARLKPFAPQIVHDSDSREWEATKINERLHVGRYRRGEHYSTHTDHAIIFRQGCEETFLTITLYLTGMDSGVQGGATVLYVDESASKEQKTISVEPISGTVAIYPHTLKHEGTAVKAGSKYIIRTEIVFIRRGSQAADVSPVPAGRTWCTGARTVSLPEREDFHSFVQTDSGSTLSLPRFDWLSVPMVAEVRRRLGSSLSSPQTKSLENVPNALTDTPTNAERARVFTEACGLLGEKDQLSELHRCVERLAALCQEQQDVFSDGERVLFSMVNTQILAEEVRKLADLKERAQSDGKDDMTAAIATAQRQLSGMCARAAKTMAYQSEMQQTLKGHIPITDITQTAGPSSNNDAMAAVAFVETLKAIGDFSRFTVEESAQMKMLRAYHQGSIHAKRNLRPTHPTRLTLFLNYSIALKEIGDIEAAIAMSKDAFDDALSELDTLCDEESYQSSTLIMQLLRDNVTDWMEELERTSQTQWRRAVFDAICPPSSERTMIMPGDIISIVVLYCMEFKDK